MKIDHILYLLMDLLTTITYPFFFNFYIETKEIKSLLFCFFTINNWPVYRNFNNQEPAIFLCYVPVLRPQHYVTNAGLFVCFFKKQFSKNIDIFQHLIQLSPETFLSKTKVLKICWNRKKSCTINKLSIGKTTYLNQC